MRRRSAPAKTIGGMPSELAIGCCIEAWAADKPKPWSPENWQGVSAWSRHSESFRAWVDSLHLSPEQHHPAKPARSPYSVDFLVEQDEAARAEQYLARGGAAIRDLDVLRAAAQRRLSRARVSRGVQLTMRRG